MGSRRSSVRQHRRTDHSARDIECRRGGGREDDHGDDDHTDRHNDHDNEHHGHRHNHQHRRHGHKNVHRHHHECIYDATITKQIQLFYAGSAFAWILLCYSLGVQKAKSKIGLLIVAMPIVIYALAFLNANKITKRVERTMLSADFLAFGLLFVSVLFQMGQSRPTDYTVRIIVVSLILLIMSTVDVWTGEKGLTISKHVRSAARTAAVTLLIFVIYVNVTESRRKSRIVMETDAVTTTAREEFIDSVYTPGRVIHHHANKTSV